MRAAKAVGLQTGGWMPRGYRTLDGDKPIYADLYGVHEHASSRYPPRTFANVRDADATLRIAWQMHSAGEVCTHQAIVRHRKPNYDIELADPRSLTIDDRNWFIGSVAPPLINFLMEKNVSILNVAGNSEFTAPGIEKKAEWMLTVLFRAIKFREAGVV